MKEVANHAVRFSTHMLLPLVLAANTLVASTTYAAISPAIIDIRDEAAQKAKTGQTAEETLSGLSRDPANANNALAKIFDQKKVEETQELTRVLGEEIYKGIGDLAANRRKAALDEEAKATQRAKDAQLAGDANAQAAAEAEAKIARDRAESWNDGGAYKIALHALGGAVLAKAGNASVTQAVAAATLNEITIPTIAELAKKEKLSEGETKLLHQLTSLAVGGAVGGSTGAVVALTATQNNYLKHDEIKKLIDAKSRLSQCSTDACRTEAQQEIDQLQALSQQRDDALAACQGDTSSRCNGLRQEVRSAYAEIIRNTGSGTKVARNTPGVGILDYSSEAVRTHAEADKTLSQLDRLGGTGLGFAESVIDSLVSLTQGVAITYKAVTGDRDAQDQIGKTVDGIATLASTPSLWGQILDNASAEHRERLASAYERGDSVELGKIAGEVLSNIPGGVVGATRKVPGAIDDVAKLAEKVKGAEKVVEGPAKDAGKYARRTNVEYKTAEEINATFPKELDPPYKLGTRVTEFTAVTEEKFVRFHGEGNQVRDWVVKEEAVRGLTPAQIQSKYSLKYEPAFVSDVTVPPGTRIRTGTANSLFGGAGNSTQYQILDEINPSWFSNRRSIR